MQGHKSIYENQNRQKKKICTEIKRQAFQTSSTNSTRLYTNDLTMLGIVIISMHICIFLLYEPNSFASQISPDDENKNYTIRQTTNPNKIKLNKQTNKQVTTTLYPDHLLYIYKKT